MAASPRLNDLADAVVVYRDSKGGRARFHVERVTETRAVCRYVFEHELPPVRCHEGERVELGLRADNGWIEAVGHVAEIHRSGAIAVEVEDLELVQRRRAYRQRINLRVTVQSTTASTTARGNTEDLSIGGFSARLHGWMVPPEGEVLVEFALPEGGPLTVRARKVAGDLPQRFKFLTLDRASENRIVRVVRRAELEARRDERNAH